MGLADRLYASLPLWGQHAAISLYGAYWRWLRFGPGYKEALAGYLAREHYSYEQWRGCEGNKLRELLRHASEDIEYYAETWGKEAKKAAEAGRLHELPLLGKDPIRQAPERFLRRGLRPGRLHTFVTSGSTGTPIQTYWTVREIRDSLALREARSARWAGVSFALPRATFSGRIVEPNPDKPAAVYRYNAMAKQVYFSAFHLSPATAERYVDALRRHRTVWLTGYAVSAYLLAKFSLDQHLPMPRLKAVVTTSEKVTPEMRQVMERAYGCRVFEEYSTVENAVFASECEQRRLHVSPDAGIVEILRQDGSPCDPGEVGEVVATSFTRWHQLFIRYRLGDLAAWDDVPCPCGRQMPVLKEVCGRLEDVVYGQDGRQLVRFHGVFVGMPHVREGQVIQDGLSVFRVKVVPDEGFGDADVGAVIERMKQRLGKDTHVQVEVVPAIERTAAGKFRAVVCNLTPENRKQLGELNQVDQKKAPSPDKPGCP